MSKVKFYYNTKSLKYERVQVRIWDKILRVVWFLATAAVFAAVTIYIAYTYFDSPKEKKLRREISELTYQYEVLNRKMNQLSVVLEDMQERDDNLYRSIFEADPIPATVRKAGFGGVDRYKGLEGFDNSSLIIETAKKLDRISKQVYVQSKSFDDIVNMVKNKEVMLSSIPAIQPISNKDLKHVPSGYGWRTDPIYKTPDFHPGIDFTANTGTKIYATGDGTVERADDLAQGYGNHVVISHGFGYHTLYAHMSKMLVKPGQKVKRGELIGLVGNTGRSTGPHVHYEVIRNGEKINPVNFFYNDLTPAEYQKMIEISSTATQAFD